jgi:hypothetical protein
MSSDPVRKFHLSDAAILIAATAVGLAIVRYYLATPNVLIRVTGPKNVITMTPSLVDRGRRDAAAIAAILLAAWSIALVGIGLRTPRPPLKELKELMERPGSGACFNILVIIVTVVLITYLGALLQGNMPFIYDDRDFGGTKMVFARLDPFANQLLPILTFLGGPQVALIWIIAVVRRRWHGPCDWIEQGGRILGVGWILVSIASFPPHVR